MRAVALAVPVAAVVVLGSVCRVAGDTDARGRRLAAAIVGTAWAGLALLPVNLLALRTGWWSFAADGAVWSGVPLDLVLAWALLWGAVPALVPRRVPAVALAAVLVWVDLAVMPLGAPVVTLGDDWLAGEALAVAAALVPALALARWTLAGRRTELRGWAQAVCAAGLFLGLPVTVLGVASPWPAPVTGGLVQLLALACVPGIAAMRELARVGRGTPLPYDPPSRLVVSGPYAYVRNPMQVTVVLVFVVLAVLLVEPWLLGGAASAVVYGAGLAAWHEGEQLRASYGDAWLRYRAAVPAWVPLVRPAAPATAVLYVAADCGQCTGVGRWFTARRPVGLELRPAAEHAEVLWRITYEAGDVREEGVAALARALGHVNLGWALVGWTLDLPGLRHFAQLGADAFGAGPRPSRRACSAPGAP